MIEGGKQVYLAVESSPTRGICNKIMTKNLDGDVALET